MSSKLLHLREMVTLKRDGYT